MISSWNRNGQFAFVHLTDGVTRNGYSLAVLQNQKKNISQLLTKKKFVIPSKTPSKVGYNK
jgi:hypothetical protein